jgi:hypothetical protein
LQTIANATILLQEIVVFAGLSGKSGSGLQAHFFTSRPLVVSPLSTRHFARPDLKAHFLEPARGLSERAKGSAKFAFAGRAAQSTSCIAIA